LLIGYRALSVQMRLYTSLWLDIALLILCSFFVAAPHCTVAGPLHPLSTQKLKTGANHAKE
jgi:hypothetical protein